MKLNRYLYLTLLFFLLGCSEDFLDYSPQGQQSADAFEPFSAVVACYNDLADFDNRQNIWTSYVMGDLISDDAWKGGRNQNDQVELLQLGNFTAVPSNDALDDIWNVYYSRIFRFNWTIDGLESFEGISEQRRARFLGEVKFMRGIHFFWLNRMFNGVPMPLEPFSEDNKVLARSTPQQVYAQIEMDLIDAIESLPTKGQLDLATERGRVTKEAAQAFLAKVYLYQQKWDLAQQTAKQVIESNAFELMPELGQIFTFEGEFSSESVFEVNYVPTDEQTNGTLHGRAQRSPNGFRGWGFNAPTSDLLNAFEPGDPRKVLTILFEGDSAFDQRSKLVALNHKGYFNPERMHSRKAFIPGTLFPESNSNLSENLRLMRYAEVLLIYAEAANENNQSTEALIYLNQVRERARNSSKVDPYRKFIKYKLESPAVLLPEITTTNKDELREIIRHERRVELAMEGERFYDLVRWGIADDVLHAFADKYDSEKGRAFTTGVHEYFPIPQVEVDLSLGKIKQNPGY